MAALSEDTLRERETIIRWDETGEMATLWTASARVRREWEQHGFPVSVLGGGWQSQVPVDRVAYKVFKKIMQKQA